MTREVKNTSEWTSLIRKTMGLVWCIRNRDVEDLGEDFQMFLSAKAGEET